MNNIKKAVLDAFYIIISLIICWISYLVINSTISLLFNKPISDLFYYAVSIVISILFSMSLVYTKHFFHEKCLQTLICDYKNKKYSGILNDLIFHIFKEEWRLTILIILICVIHAFTRSDIIRLAFMPMFLLTSRLDSAFSYLICLSVILSSYYIYLSIYRKNLYNLSFEK